MRVFGQRCRSRWAGLVALLLLGACGGSSPEDPSLEPPVLPQRKLTVSGTRLLDALGREVILRGYNAGGRAKMPPFLPFDVPAGATVDAAAADYFGRIAALGANLVRLTFSWEAFEGTEGTYDTAYLAQYRSLIDAAHAEGLAVIVDFHQDVFASPFCGDGFPLWAIGTDIPYGDPHYDCGFPQWALPVLDPASDVSLAFDRLWNNTDGLADKMEAMWRELAASLGDHPGIAGFEVINEPGSGSGSIETFESTVLPALYERMGTAIGEEAPGFPIFGGGRAGDAVGGTNALTKPNLPAFVFAPHYYDAAVVVGVAPDPAGIRTRVGNTLAPAAEWNVPVILGEFGAMNDYAQKGEYLDIVFDVLDEQRAHGALWDASMSPLLWNSEDFSVLTPTGEEQPWAGSVVRAYPRAIAGEIVRFGWDAEATRFELEVANAGSEVSEVYLPTRHLGDRPSIRVDGARYRFVRDRELLLLAAEPGATYTVVVTR